MPRVRRASRRCTIQRMTYHVRRGSGPEPEKTRKETKQKQSVRVGYVRASKRDVAWEQKAGPQTATHMIRPFFLTMKGRRRRMRRRGEKKGKDTVLKRVGNAYVQKGNGFEKILIVRGEREKGTRKILAQTR